MVKIEPEDVALAEDLYTKANVTASQSPEGMAKIFNQQEMLGFDVVHNVTRLLPLTQYLSNQQLLRSMLIGEALHFNLRARDVAEKLRRISQDDLMVYQNVENAGGQGMWIKAIKQKSKLAQNVINKSIKTLESRELIRSFRNIKNPSQKYYILTQLQPGEDVTGGSWHGDGELDIDLITVTADAIVHFVEMKSWIKQHVKVDRHRSISPLPLSDEPVDDERAHNQNHRGSGTKRPRDAEATDDIEDVPHRAKRYRHRHPDRIETQLSYPPGYTDYPTTTSILAFVKEANFIKTTTELKEEAIASILKVLELDGRVERMPGGGYRTLRGVRGASEAMKGLRGQLEGPFPLDEDVEPTGLMGAPCGMCPVFNLCQEGGPVNPENCEYFETWLRS